MSPVPAPGMPGYDPLAVSGCQPSADRRSLEEAISMPAQIQPKTPVEKLAASVEEQKEPIVVGRKQKVRKVRARVLTQFTVQLATLQNAGLPIVKCLRILEGQMRSGPFKETIALVIEDVESG